MDNHTICITIARTHFQMLIRLILWKVHSMSKQCVEVHWENELQTLLTFSHITITSDRTVKQYFVDKRRVEIMNRVQDQTVD